MAERVVVPCAANTWVKATAAGGVASATIHRLGLLPNLYIITYVAAGGLAPTDDSKAALMFSKSPNEEDIKSTPLIDVYVKAVGAAGSVGVDA